MKLEGTTEALDKLNPEAGHLYMQRAFIGWGKVLARDDSIVALRIR